MTNERRLKWAVDASALERNLYFTIELLELDAPLVIALNQIDFAAKKGIMVDAQRLSEMRFKLKLDHPCFLQDRKSH